ncbi:G-type lectin S-receptor-like serine/threonine-protein kinase At4g03230 [Gastrolobium bilobum]|uniref:G-type lectin S-receptor-like serine/threonine-protein kinase At4g03230 n=1 Tax=Gastrolobium bilobum TaxID=150636 RepID=UPI002AB2F4B0|nr:G-type lectin S-receptor-like serine/threonine-protein kinase At4g03230 [Gastrolobium bilobum]
MTGLCSRVNSVVHNSFYRTTSFPLLLVSLLLFSSHPLQTIMDNMRAIILFHLYAWLLCFSQPPLPCLARDTLNAGEKIIGNETTLVSAGKKFELGFFFPVGNITGVKGRYLGIWYYRQDGSEPYTVVWVANRDKPVTVDSTGVFQIAKDGNLVVADTSSGKKNYWSSELKNSSSANKTVKLMDSGNLVLLDEDLGIKLWQSFEHPTDTFLPGMKMDKNLGLTSWRSLEDPGSGSFTFKMAQTSDHTRFIILNNDQLHWESEDQQYSSNSEATPGDISIEVYFLLTNFTTLIAKNLSLMSYENTRLFINSTGVIQFKVRGNFQEESSQWLQPKTMCLIYNNCGNFSSCNDNDRICKCLPGFDPMSPQNDVITREGDSSLQGKGCIRKTASCAKDATFLNLVMMKIRSPDKKVTAANESECQSMCLNTCPQCEAYSYATPTTRRDLNPTTCWIWTHNLTTLVEEYLDGDDRKLFVRVDKSDIEPTPKTCEPCGTNIVPYPLSTGPSCGDPNYFKFSCNNSTGQLSFFPNTTDQTYPITSMDPDSKKFSILLSQDYSFNRYCGEREKNLSISSPFSNDNLCSNQLEVSWQPPSEPTCAESIDCLGWKHSTCKGNRCLCDANYYWHGDLLSCTEKAISSSNPIPTIEDSTRKGNSKSSLSLTLSLSLTGVVILACTLIFAYVCRRKIALKQDRENIQRNRGRFYDSERHVKDLIDMEGLQEQDNEGIEVPYFDFESILVATDHFSEANKLGKGGYGPVYKGKLQGGQDIAVKRLSSVSSQGLQEFKNEVVLIAKLQHRNLVRLRGYCVKGEEKILLYEYMPNKSLDLFIFDATQSVLLDWPMRFDIILGVARGLLYLHQDSRLRVIHRDLKTSNILLDGEMQPKISDFGLARIFGPKETEANTERVVGTYGYMSPEYALDGLFSIKSDVFSFGVVLLEIISGKKNTGFYQSNSSLLGYAWRLWEENKLLDLMDLSLGETCNPDQFVRCARIALLCVQDEPDDRPTMSNILTMLDSETITLPIPKQATFFARKDLPSTSSSSVRFESSTQEGR